MNNVVSNRGDQWHSWLRYYSVSRKVAGSIPREVFEIFYWLDSSGRVMSLWLTQSLKDKSTRDPSSVVKAVGA